MSPSKYVQEVVDNCGIYTKEHYDGKYSLLKEADTPFVYHYRPEVDISNPLGSYMASYYQSIIGIMRWMIELGRDDIATEVYVMSSHNAYPCQRHF